ncbi:non-canonical purine NTP pyrophosphatase [Croceivirga radicis]|uniref:dITP/XTP pyrophosphatase n=1 Tax=Croceivirga radicis TaxID=1929488 RepID=A0A1V6LTF5_9FLAO|nr:non-canonical purine NTP diphosphatase [Croceivirga radicis]OQD43438.1 non-canonical purine NTP pyrophosphatase [Croceivirga radicis]
MQLVFATHNKNKFKEVAALMPNSIDLLSLDMIGCFEDIKETGTTLEENAKLKSDYIFRKYKFPCFADDTGLLVPALDSEPGVFSARYAGPQKNAEDNMAKLLKNLDGVENRSAYFKTIISLQLPIKHHFFEGRVNGVINKEKSGNQGFGYDPIFRPDGHSKTFAELPLSVKNEIGHRGKAIQQLISFLQQL